MKRSIQSLALGLLAAAIVAGCGGGSSEKAKVEETLQGYLSAFAKGDGDEACSKMSGPENRRFFTEMAEQVPELRATSCADAVTKLAESLGASERAELEHAEVRNVKLEGDHATALAQGAMTTAELTKERSDWVITGGLAGESAREDPSDRRAAERESQADEVMEVAAAATRVVACLEGHGAAAEQLGESGYEEVTARARDGAAIGIYLFVERRAASAAVGDLTKRFKREHPGALATIRSVADGRVLVATAGRGSGDLLAPETDERSHGNARWKPDRSGRRPRPDLLCRRRRAVRRRTDSLRAKCLDH